MKLSFSTTNRIALGLTGLLIGFLLVVLYRGTTPDAVQTKSEGHSALTGSEPIAPLAQPQAPSKIGANEPARLINLPSTNSPSTGMVKWSDFAQGSPLWDDLNTMDQQLRSQIAKQQLVVGATLAASICFTLGYVIWMLRGGMLTTSLLAQMPAWRLLDPLVILNWTGNFENGGKQETREAIGNRLEDCPFEPAAQREVT